MTFLSFFKEIKLYQKYNSKFEFDSIYLSLKAIPNQFSYK